MPKRNDGPERAVTVHLQEGGPAGGPVREGSGRRRGRGTVVAAVVACGVFAAGAAFAAAGDDDRPTLGETTDLAVAAPVDAARAVVTPTAAPTTVPPTTAAPVPETTAAPAPQALSVAAEMQPAPTTTAAPKPKAVVPATTKPAPVETVKKDKPPVVAFTAVQAFGSCAENPPYDEFSGTANPGGWVKVISSYGDATTTADAAGNWSVRVDFPSAPVGKSFPVKVKTEQGYKEFAFIRTA